MNVGKLIYNLFRRVYIQRITLKIEFSYVEKSEKKKTILKTNILKRIIWIWFIRKMSENN